MNDPIVTEVRRIRERRAAKFGFDLKRIMADARRRERAATLCQLAAADPALPADLAKNHDHYLYGTPRR